MTSSTAPLVYDAFVSYARRDKAIVDWVVRQLSARGMRCWIDTDPSCNPPGELTDQALLRGIAASRASLIFIGPLGTGDYQQFEITNLLARKELGRQRLIPVKLPDVDDDKLGFLLGFTYVTMTSAEDDAAVATIAQVLDRELADTTPKSVERVRADDQEELDDALAGLIEAARERNLSLFIGSGFASSAERLSPPRWELGGPLLKELGLGEGGKGVALPPSDIAASYFAARHDRGRLERRVAEMFPRDPELPPAEYESLAELVRHIKSTPPGRSVTDRPIFVVTTNFDLLIERAFIRAGVSCARLVVQRDALAIRLARFLPFVEDDGRHYLHLSSGASRSIAYDRDSARSLDQALAAAAADEQKIDVADKLATSTTYSEISAILLDPTIDVVMIKYHGSFDVPQSCALSTDDLLALACRFAMPPEITGYIAGSAWIFLGYDVTDTELLQLRHSLLRGSLGEVGGDRDRVFVCDPGEQGRFGSNPTRKMLRDCVTPNRERAVLKLFRAQLLLAWERDVLRRMLALLSRPE